LWGKALNLATNRVALAQMTYITPILSLVIISIVLGEVVGLLTVGGLLLIISGILVSSLKRV
jgi:drug/metabolite transporter (DMT)-like permease